MLSQSRPHPSGIEVSDVVAYGRHPHRGRFSGVSDADRAAVARALALTGLSAMADRPVDQLSGGELQRVWLATALAQDTGVLLLDEPTNHLDLRYQVETLDLVRELADDHGTALGVVLHDLDHAASVADDVVLMHRGRVHAAGAPAEVLTGENLSQVYGLRIDTALDEETGLVREPPMKKTPLAVLALGGALTLALAGCGTTQTSSAEGSDAPTSTSAGCTDDTTSTSTGAVSVTDDLGRTVELDKPAERIAVLEWQQIEDALSLCVTPVAVADAEGYSTWVTAEELPEGVVDVGTRQEPNLETLFGTDPDLVIVEVRAADDPIVAQLEAYDVP
ncbi:unnamed protein product, partial [Penicillium discolor]